MDIAADNPGLPERLAAAEAALQHSEARLAALLATVPVGVAMIDADGRIVDANAEYLRFCPTGMMPSRDETRVARWRGWDEAGRALSPTDFPGARAQRGESVVPGQEMLYTDDDGGERWVRVATVPIRDAAGTVTGQASVVSDIDALKRLSEARREGERSQALLLQLSDAIRPLDDPAAIADCAVDLLGAHLAIDRCTYVEFIEDDDRHHIVVAAEYRTVDAASFVGLHDAAGFGDDLIPLQAGQVVAVADVEQEAGADVLRAKWRDLNIRSRLGVPVMRNGRLVTALTIQHRAPRPWSPGDVRLVREAAERTWVAVEHARARARLRRKDAALREAQARAQLLVEGIAVATWEAPRDGRVTVDSPSWRRLTGQSYEAFRGFGWMQAIHPDDRAPVMAQWQDARDHGRGTNLEYRLRLRDGTYRWVNARAIPLFDAAGHVEKWVGMNIDIDARKRLERTVTDNERRMRALVEGGPQLLWRASPGGAWNWASPQWAAFTGQPERASHGAAWLAMLHPDDRAAAERAWAQAEARGGFDIEHRLRRADGVYRWFSTRAVPVCDDHGAIVEWLGTSNDIHALREAQDRQDVMVVELQHRTRNLIAVIRSIADRMIDGAPSLAAFEAGFGERLSALSRVQALLSCTATGRRVTFGELLDAELLAHGAIGRRGGDAHLTLDGPADVPLRSGAVQSLALAIHELATNAVKYGALRDGRGRLAIAWHVEQEADGVPWLHVDWRESDVDLPAPTGTPPSGGYGRQLIERALPYQLGARTEYAFTRDGVHCRIAVPVVSTRTDKDNEDG